MMSKTPYALIALLSDGEFHSGEAIGDLFKISRSAVWKQLKKVVELGIEVETVKGKGYRVVHPFNLLDREAICALLNHHLPAATLDILPVTTSTNDLFNRKIFNKEAVGKGDLILAEQQTAGKGRRGRVWHSLFARNIIMSMVWSFDQGMTKLDGLSLVVGLALVEALRSMSVPEVKLKWPNDVMVKDRKVAGILLEMNGDPTAECFVVIGVGLNVNMQGGDMEGVDQPWISVSQALGQNVDRTAFINIFLEKLIYHLQVFEKEGFEVFRSRWGETDWLKEKAVAIKTGNTIIFGEARGVNTQGGILIDQEGVLHAYTSGEVSVRRAG